MKILAVCLGNICRSPLAEGLLVQEIAKRGLDWQVASAGTGSWHIGERPDPRSIEVARQHGLDISTQRARQFQATDFQQYDLILAMDSANHRDILALAQTEEERQKVYPILAYSGLNRTDPNVPDPYWDDDGFQQVYHMLKKAVQQTVDKIIATQ